MECLECLSLGFAYLKFHPTDPDPYLCAILPKNYTLMDLVQNIWEGEEIRGRSPKIVNTNETSGNYFLTGNRTFKCFFPYLLTLIFLSASLVLGVITTAALLTYILLQYLSQYISREVTNSCITFVRRYYSQS